MEKEFVISDAELRTAAWSSAAWATLVCARKRVKAMIARVGGAVLAPAGPCGGVAASFAVGARSEAYPALRGQNFQAIQKSSDSSSSGSATMSAACSACRPINRLLTETIINVSPIAIQKLLRGERCHWSQAMISPVMKKQIWIAARSVLNHFLFIADIFTASGASLTWRTLVNLKSWPVCGMSIRMERSPDARSEEHTSELQSQSNLVCRLLLEKKKRNKTLHSIYRTL